MKPTMLLLALIMFGCSDPPKYKVITEENGWGEKRWSVGMWRKDYDGILQKEIETYVRLTEVNTVPDTEYVWLNYSVKISSSLTWGRHVAYYSSRRSADSVCNLRLAEYER